MEQVEVPLNRLSSCKKSYENGSVEDDSCKNSYESGSSEDCNRKKKKNIA